MTSKKKLFKFLATIAPKVDPGLADVGELQLNHPRVYNETYGRKSCIYIGWASAACRTVGENQLKRAGFCVNRNYSRGSASSEITVSYFKG